MSIEDKAKAASQTIKEKGQDIITTVRNNIEEAKETVADKATNLISHINASVDEGKDSEVIASIDHQGKAVVEDAKEAGQASVDTVADIPSDETKDKAKKAVSKTQDGIEEAKNSLVDTTQKATEKVNDGVKGIKDKLKKTS